MSGTIKVGLVPFSAPRGGTLIVFCNDALQFGPKTRKMLGSVAEHVRRNAQAANFKGKLGAAMDVLAPAGLKVSRLVDRGRGQGQ